MKVHHPIIVALVVFFGASVIFNLVNNLVEDESVAVRLGFQVAVLALLVGGAVLYVRSSGDD